MNPVAWAAFVLLAGILVAYAVWIYRMRELPIRGRAVLAGLRSATLLLLVLLLWNPSLPGDPVFGAGRDWLLVDASESMAVEAAQGGANPWDSARAVARARARSGIVATFGEQVRVLEDGASLAERPAELGSALAPALERAAEAGARRVTVVSDMRFEDPVAVEAARARLGLELDWVDVGGEPRNAGVEAVDVPPTVRAGEGATMEVVVFASGTSPSDSLRVEVLQDGRPVAVRPVAAPSPGRRARTTIELPPADAPGIVRYEARVGLDGDAYAADDARAAYVSVAAEEGALVLISLAPDWEPRFLLPVLSGVTGLGSRGFLAAGPDRFLTMGTDGAQEVVGAETVSRAARAAELLVLHGVGEAPPTWLADAAAEATRLLLLASSPGALTLVGLTAGDPRPGEWYVSAELPPSPLAGDLAGAPLAGLPPLGPLLPSGDPGAGEVALRLQLRGSGPALPALVLRRGDGRRSATALASGFWRWAFRPGDAREAYRRLWSGVAGWLLAQDPRTSDRDVEPVEPVVEAGERPLWSAGGGAPGDSVSLRVSRGDTVVLDTAVVTPAGALFRTPPLPPGRYTFSAARGADTSSGVLEVAGAPELAHPRIPPPAAGAADGRTSAGAVVRRPVRTHPVPYVLLLALLAVEWTLRRRRGLR